jgi:hypothetical protein
MVACHPMRISEAVVKLSELKAAQRCVAQINSVEFCRDSPVDCSYRLLARYTGTSHRMVSLCLAFGALFAQTFRVFALAPASFMIFIISFAVAETVETKLLTAGMATTALQAGYLIGNSFWIGHPLLSEPS